MTRIVIKKGSVVPVGRAAGLIYAGIDEIYPIVGRYSTQPPDKRGSIARHELKHVLTELAGRVAPLRHPKHSTAATPLPVSVWADYQIISDSTNNTPDLTDQGRIAVTILIKPSRIPEFYGGTFILARVLHNFGSEERERYCLEVEYRPLAGM